MRFTIRHLLWFTLLAAIACWWWIPSKHDAKVEGYCLDLLEGDLRFESQSALEFYGKRFLPGPAPIDFKTRDALVVGSREPEWQFAAILRSRASGKLVLIEKTCSDPFQALITVKKGAYVLHVTPVQVNLIDGGVAGLLLLFAAASLLIGRKPAGCPPAGSVQICVAENQRLNGRGV